MKKEPMQYAVYRGDEFLCLGSAVECAEKMGWKNAKTTQYYASPAYRRKLAKRNTLNALQVIKIEED